MPKRCNPFVDDFTQQTKIRIGLKQFNNNEERLKQVHEKTMNLLFKGAKLAPFSKTPFLATCNSKRPDKLKQLFISTDGTLQQDGTLVPCEEFNNRIECCCDVSFKETKCSYCDMWLCELCCQYCTTCHKHYCSKCSFNSDDNDSVCVSCYK